MLDYATRDLILAILHHVIIFALFGLIIAELLMVRPGLAPAQVKRLGIVDAHYGLFAGLILVVGFARAKFAAKGWDYYEHNHFFWAKIMTFLVIGAISIWPTVKIFGWKKAAKAGGPAPLEAEIKRVRQCLIAELALFPLLLAFAAAMARGYGSV
jgi:putative membrane protein